MRRPTDSRRIDRVLVATLAVLAGPALPAVAQLAGEFPACTQPGDQTASSVFADGMGGAYLLWTDARGPETDVYALRTTPAGDRAPGWPADGLPICAAPGNQRAARGVADGTGGAFIAWEDTRDGDIDVRAIRINEFGRAALGWPEAGRILGAGPRSQREPGLCADTHGGVYVVWSDHRTPLDENIMVQHLDALGATPAVWPAEGKPLCAVGGSQFAPVIVGDGFGGALVAWSDWRNGLETDVFAARVGANFDVALWGTNGHAVCVATGDQQRPSIAPDGSGGAFIAWQDLRGNFYDIFVNHLRADGEFGWGLEFENGQPLCDAPGAQFAPVLVSDGDQGAIAAWFDRRSNVDYDIYAMRITRRGRAPSWDPAGVAICRAAGNQLYPAVASDGAGGVFVCWSDRRRGDNADIFASRVTVAGTPVASWPPDGVAVCTAVGPQFEVRLAANGRGGAVALWTDGRTGQGADAYAGLLRRDPVELFPAWPAGGVALCTAAGDQVAAGRHGAAAISDGSGGAFVVWTDASAAGGSDLWAQRVTGGGSIAAGWPAAGVPVCTANGVQDGACVVSDGAGGFLVAWQDQRDVSTTMDIYAQRLTGAGRVATGWAVDGVAVTQTMGLQLEPRIAFDAGGMLIVWRDRRFSLQCDIYAQRLTSAGQVEGGWPRNGRVICAAAGDQRAVDLAPDGSGNFYVGWVDERAGVGQVYLTLVPPSGAIVLPWPLGGLKMTEVAGRKDALRIVADGQGGAVLGWIDRRHRGRDLYAMRVGPNSQLEPGWPQNGAPVARGANVNRFDFTSDGMGGVFAAWETLGGLAVHAQYVRGNATVAVGWPANGMAVAPNARPQLAPSIASDGAGGARVAWIDLRHGETDLFAQHLNGDGSRGADGRDGGEPVCVAAGTQGGACIVVDRALGSALVVWHDRRGADMDVYAAQLGPVRNAVDVALTPLERMTLEVFPNPFVGSVRLVWSTPGGKPTQFEVFDVAGRRLRALPIPVPARDARRFEWDGRDSGGMPVAAGVYLVRILGPGFEARTKLIRAR